MTRLSISNGNVRSINEEKRQFTVLAQSEQLVRQDGYLLLKDAAKKRISEFEANPIVCTNHKRTLDSGFSSVIGKVVENRFVEDGLEQIIELSDSTLGEDYWKLIKGGYLRAVSISFSDIEAEYDINKCRKLLESRRIKLQPEEWQYLRGVVTSYKLLETSIVAIGADSKALARLADEGNELARDIILNININGEEKPQTDKPEDMPMEVEDKCKDELEQKCDEDNKDINLSSEDKDNIIRELREALADIQKEVKEIKNTLLKESVMDERVEKPLSNPEVTPKVNKYTRLLSITTETVTKKKTESKKIDSLFDLSKSILNNLK